MDNLDKFFKGQYRDEEFICFFRHHWVALLKEFFYFSIFLFVVITGFLLMPEIKDLLRGNKEVKLFFVTAYLIGTIFLHRFFLKLLNHFVNVGIITDRRVIDHKKTLFFQDTKESIDTALIQNIERISKGIWPSLLRYGNIRIYLNASDAIIHFNVIPNAKFIFRCINRQKELRQKTLRGVQVDRLQQRITAPSTPITPFKELTKK
jgi:hypothetical protein